MCMYILSAGIYVYQMDAVPNPKKPEGKVSNPLTLEE